MNVRRIISLGVVAVFVICFSLLIASKINLTTADLGRYIQNGEILLHGSSAEKSALLHTNFYSYTHQDFPFINHHWGTGIIFYLIWVVAGFNGLSIFYIVVGILTFLLSFYLAKHEGTMITASVAVLLFLPILVSRREVRPEMITYLFSLVFFAALWLYRQGSLSKKWLWALIPLQLFWVNIHIGFFFGETIVGLFLIEAMLTPHRNWKEIKTLGIILGCAFLVTLINPNGIHGALYPLFIFSNFGYTLVENQSVLFLENYGFHSVEFAMLKIILFVVAICLCVHVIKHQAWRFLYNPLVIISVGLGILGFMQIRHMIMFGFFGVILFSYLLAHLFKHPGIEKAKYIILASVVLVLVIETSVLLHSRGANNGIGLLPGVEGGAAFYRANNLHGPIFNNYDIGGYLIYELQGKEKLFVDNRPEAYPATFFSDVYIPSQTDDATWKRVNAKYNFNTIWFYRQDLTPWGQTMLEMRLQDPEWALVYLDNYSVIFIKRSPENQAIIQQYEIKVS